VSRDSTVRPRSSGEAGEGNTDIPESGGVCGIEGICRDTTEILGIGFAGVKGFAGGFGRGALGPWGEDIMKKFVHEAVSEALKLESALARLRTDHRIAILHYAPIQGTVEGEPLEIYPFLGCSRLEEPLGRYPVSDHVELRANLTNLTDKRYYDAIYRSGTPFSYVAPGRQATVSVTITL